MEKTRNIIPFFFHMLIWKKKNLTLSFLNFFSLANMMFLESEDHATWSKPKSPAYRTNATTLVML